MSELVAYKVRRFASLMDAIMWAAHDLNYALPPRPCGGPEGDDYCELDRPCRRHRNAPALGAALWRRQLRRDRLEQN